MTPNVDFVVAKRHISLFFHRAHFLGDSLRGVVVAVDTAHCCFPTEIKIDKAESRFQRLAGVAFTLCRAC